MKLIGRSLVLDDMSLGPNVTRLTDFWKFFAKKFRAKTPKYLVAFWAIVSLAQKKPKCKVTFWDFMKNVSFKLKIAFSTFWPNFGTNWATFKSNIWPSILGMTTGAPRLLPTFAFVPFFVFDVATNDLKRTFLKMGHAASFSLFSTFLQTIHSKCVQ